MAGLLISEADAKRLRRVLQWFERQERGGGPSPGGGARPGFWIESWIGLVAAQGPNGEEDYTDERYWVERARCANAAGGEEGELALEALDEADPLAKCVTATDLAEIADGTHALGVGSAVAVFAAYDQQTPPAKHYWFGGGGAGGEGAVENPYELLPASFSDLDAQIDIWTRSAPQEGTQGVVCRKQTREAWDGTNGKLYAFTRDYTYDSRGRLDQVSAETRHTVDIAEECPA